MPAALGLLLPAGLGASISIGGIALTTAAGSLTLAGSLVSLAGSLLLQTAFGQKPEGPSPQDGQLNFREDVGPRRLHYGRVRVGGQMVYFRVFAGVFYKILVHGAEPVFEIEKFIVDKKHDVFGSEFIGLNTPVIVDEMADGKGRVYVRLYARKGTVPGVPFSDLVATDAEVDNTHRLDGLFTSMMTALQGSTKRHHEAYQSGLPTHEVVAKTAMPFDPRIGANAYSENAALGIAYLIEHPDGFNLSGRVNQAALSQAADDCDDAISLAAGGTEPRYRMAGTWTLDEAPSQVLTRMLRACAGDVRLLPDGSIGIYAGKWRDPTLTLTTSDVISVSDYDTGPDALDRYSELPFTYVDQDLDFVQTSGDTWRNSDLESEYGGAVPGSALDLRMCPSPTQGRRLCKIKTSQDNHAKSVRVTFKIRAMPAIYERFITLDVPELGLSGHWRVEKFDLRFTDASVTLDLTSADPAAYDWNGLAEDGILPTQVGQPAPQATIPAPANTAAAASGVQISQGSFAAGIGVAWDEPPFPGLSMRVGHSLAGVESWTEVEVSSEDDLAYQITSLIDGQAYDIRLSWFGLSLESDYTYERNVIASADASAPAAPSGFTATSNSPSGAETGDLTVSISFTASASASIRRTEILRDGVAVLSIYTDQLQYVEVTDAPGAGTFAYTARSYNVSEIASATYAGPITVTVAEVPEGGS